jgi:uncharacterized protein YcbX
MWVDGLWRYPVKSLRGEALTVAELTLDGVAGDRVVRVRRRGGPLTGRTRHSLLTITATTGDDGEPLVDGHSWRSAHANELVAAAAGPDAELAEYRGPERFDIGNLLVATDGAVEHFGYEVTRLRPNILLGGVDGLAEFTWPGRAVRIGDALIGVVQRRGRCVVTTIDPETGEQNLDVLRKINRQFDGRLALDCWVITPGTIRLGDPAELTDTDARPRSLGGWIVGAPYDVA